MASKPLTAAAALLVASSNRPNAPSPAPASSSAAKLQGTPASQLTELEHEVPVESLRVDSLAVMKIVKHAREAAASGSSIPASGQLLGIDAAGVLNVSDAFPLPLGSLAVSNDGEDRRVNKTVARYTFSILPRLSALGADANIVGFYCSTINGQHLSSPGFLDTLISMQIGLAAPPASRGAKPSVPAIGKSKSLTGKGIALVYDLASSNQGTLHLKAYRLSKTFIETYRSGAFDSQNLANHKLKTSNLLEEIPLTIQSSALLTAFLATLIAPSSESNSSSIVSNASWLHSSTGGACKLVDFLPSFSPLGLASSATPESPVPVSETLAATVASLEIHNTALSTLSFQTRQLARDRVRLESVIAKRKADNETRVKQGLPPLPPSAEELALQEPSRLETMCALSGVDGAAKKLCEASGLGVVRAFGAKAGAQ